MKTKNYKLHFLLSILAVSILFQACRDNNDYNSVPVVQTSPIRNITSENAIGGGNVTDDGGCLIINRGICWDIQPQPTISLSTKTSDGKGTGLFCSTISNLIPDQQYFVRAYAINEVGLSYGPEISFFTPKKKSVIYKTDGRSVRYGDLAPISLDLSGDGIVDFTLFIELTANSQGDRLYLGINPIGPNQIKSGPAIMDNYLNMGFLVAETAGSIISESLLPDQRWTNDHGALVIKNTLTNGTIFYEGNWKDSTQIVGIQNIVDRAIFFGWLRIKYDKTIDGLTLIDYAYDSIIGQGIVTGAI